MSREINTLLTRSPEISGGRLRADGTGVTVLQIVAMYKEGYSADEIPSEYAQLTPAHVHAALAYYHANREEIEAELDSEAAEFRRLKNEHQRATVGER